VPNEAAARRLPEIVVTFSRDLSAFAGGSDEEDMRCGRVATASIRFFFAFYLRNPVVFFPVGAFLGIDGPLLFLFRQYPVGLPLPPFLD
jgi:hypothetical protein